MDLFSLINELLPLSGAQIWLLVAALVFSICVIMMFVIFWQFRQHQANLQRQELQEPEPEAMLVDMNNCTDSSRYALKKKSVMIGRMPANDAQRYDSIVISDVTVGRCHATIEYDDGIYWVRDQGSVNGCYVNGQRVEGECRLQKGDFVKFHKFNFQFIDEVASNLGMQADGAMTGSLYSAGIPSGRLDPGSSTILDIPRAQVAALSDLSLKDNDHERTQVLSRDELNREFQKVIPNPGELTDPQIRKGIQDITVRLFANPGEDKTMRLYAEDLNGPPLERPQINEEEQTSTASTTVINSNTNTETVSTSSDAGSDFSNDDTNIDPQVDSKADQKERPKEFKAENLQLVPDIDKKVMEALGDFFSSTLDDIEIPAKLELTEKGSLFAEAGSITPFPNLKAVNERKNKEHKEHDT